jgi:hypothetical protein
MPITARLVDEVPDELTLDEVKNRFMEVFGKEYRELCWWKNYSDEELRDALGEPPLPEFNFKGKPFTLEEVAQFKVKERERIRQLAVGDLRFAYLAKWIDGLTLDELKSEMKRVDAAPLTTWEGRTFKAHDYRERLKRNAAAYLSATKSTKEEDSRKARKTPKNVKVR